MKYYPINLDIRSRKCLVVGGGAVGTRKVEGLLKCGADVTVVAPEFSETLFTLEKEERIEIVKREYRSSDLEGYFLVIGAAGDRMVNEQVSVDAERRNMLCNIADYPEVCNFILPAVVEQGDLKIAISTSGKSPAFARRLKKSLEKKFGREYADFLNLMGGIRGSLLEKGRPPEKNRDIFIKLVKSDLIGYIREKDFKAVDRLLASIVGKGFSYREIMKKQETTDEPFD